MSSRHPRNTKHGKPADPSFIASSSLHADFSANSNTSISCSFARLDYLFCNAGMLPVLGSRYSIILLSCLFCQMGCFLSTGRCVAVTNPWARASTVCLQTYTEVTCCWLLPTCRRRPDGPHYLIVPGSKLSQDKVGLVFATNVLGHYALVNLMKPLLEASPRGRVMWTSSRSASPLPHV